MLVVSPAQKRKTRRKNRYEKEPNALEVQQFRVLHFNCDAFTHNRFETCS